MRQADDKLIRRIVGRRADMPVINGNYHLVAEDWHVTKREVSFFVSDRLLFLWISNVGVGLNGNNPRAIAIGLPPRRTQDDVIKSAFALVAYAISIQVLENRPA